MEWFEFGYYVGFSYVVIKLQRERKRVDTEFYAMRQEYKKRLEGLWKGVRDIETFLKLVELSESDLSDACVNGVDANKGKYYAVKSEYDRKKECYQYYLAFIDSLKDGVTWKGYGGTTWKSLIKEKNNFSIGKGYLDKWIEVIAIYNHLEEYISPDFFERNVQDVWKRCDDMIAYIDQCGNDMGPVIKLDMCNRIMDLAVEKRLHLADWVSDDSRRMGNSFMNEGSTRLWEEYFKSTKLDDFKKFNSGKMKTIYNKWKEVCIDRLQFADSIPKFR